MLTEYYSKNCTASAKYITQVVYQLRLSGINKEEIARIVPFEELNFDGHVPFLDLLNYFSKLSQIKNNPLLFVQSGLNISPSDYGLLGIIASTSENLLKAMQVTYQHQDIVSNALHREVIINGDQLFNRITDKAETPEQIANYIELAFSSLVTLCRVLTGRTEQQLAIEIHFKHSAKADVHLYQDLLKAKVKFNQEYNQIVAPTDLLKFPIKSNSPTIQQFLLEKLPQQEANLKPESPLKNDVGQYIFSCLPYDMPSLEQTAKHFNMSASTLKRRLKELGTRYSVISDSSRFKVAKQLLKNEDTDILHIALMVGYADRATFEKAFKRVFKISPVEFRAQSS